MSWLFCQKFKIIIRFSKYSLLIWSQFLCTLQKVPSGYLYFVDLNSDGFKCSKCRCRICSIIMSFKFSQIISDDGCQDSVKWINSVYNKMI